MINREELIKHGYKTYDSDGHWVSNYFNYIDAKLLQAINQQINELGWK